MENGDATPALKKFRVRGHNVLFVRNLPTIRSKLRFNMLTQLIQCQIRIILDIMA